MIAYRADIDGLRGIAVALVVLFHAGLPGISGGFIGVDIFFVISGYLITSIILSDIAKQKFSYITFYERRARRILPAFYCVASVAMIAALLMFTPKDLNKTSQSLLAALFFSGNFFFWRTTNYFSDSSDFEPFLHTWSLAVEEQFYFIFPIMLLILAPKKALLTTVCLIALALSMLLSEYATKHNTWAGYYLLPSRAWQLLAGAMLAIYPLKPIKNTVLQNILAAAALALIFIPAFLVDKNMPFPGFTAVPPTLGAVLLIYLGQQTQLFSTKLLSHRSLVFVGLISYSLYLWHWPIFAFARYFTASVELSPLVAALGILASLLTAYLSWRFVENPFRNKERFSRRSIFTLSFCYGFMLAAVCSGILLAKGLPSRLDERVIRYSNLDGGDILIDPCINKSVAQIKEGSLCFFDKKDKEPAAMDSSQDSSNFILWGDSHAAAFSPGYQHFLTATGSSGYFVGAVGCPPLPDILKLESATGPHCLNTNSAVLEFLLNNDDIHTVILHARWALSVDGERFGVEQGPSYKLQDQQNSQHGDNREQVSGAFNRLLHTLAKNNLNVIIIGPIPEMGHNVPRLSANNIQWGKNRELRVTKASFMKRQAAVFTLLQELEAQHSHINMFMPHEHLCRDNYCEVIKGDNLLYLDDDHLSREGAVLVGEEFKKWFLKNGKLR